MIWTSYQLHIVVVFCIVIFGVCMATSDDYNQLSVLCYSCTLIQSIQDEHDHYQGQIGCADPFDQTDIPRVECDAECGKVLLKTDDGFLLSRSCLSNCKPEPSREDGSFTQCCYTDLCNKATSFNSFRNSHLHQFITVMTSLVAFVATRRLP